MNKLVKFFKSPVGNLVVFVFLATVGGYMIHRSNAQEKARAAQLTKVEGNEVSQLRESIMREGKLFKVPPAVPRGVGENKQDETASAGSDSARPNSARDGRSEKSSARPRVLPISLFGATETNETTALSKTYAPFGRLIPCETVITIESSKLDTPVIGLVTEDVWHNGELIIPAGTEVHGRASLNRARERVAVSGKWVVVWRDGSPLNGAELVLNGIALDRAKDDTTGEFGLRDGSAGLLGTLVKTEDW